MKCAGANALWHACCTIRNNDAVVQWIVQTLQKSGELQTNASNKNGTTPLHGAALLRSEGMSMSAWAHGFWFLRNLYDVLDTINTLLLLGFDPTVTNKYGYTARQSVLLKRGAAFKRIREQLRNMERKAAGVCGCACAPLAILTPAWMVQRAHSRELSERRRHAALVSFVGARLAAYGVDG